MFDPTSRYAALPTAGYTLPDGRVITYAQRRLLPQSATLTVLAQVAPVQGERLDVFTARTLGDPLLFWRICDANDAMDPNGLLAHAAMLAIPLPTA